MRAGRRFRVALEAERRLVGAGKALQRAVEQRNVRDAAIGRQGGDIDRETVVLRGNQHLLGIEVLHRMIRAVVAELHLQRLGAGCQRHDLVPQADAEGGDAALDQFLGGGNRVIARLRVARSVGQEDAVRVQRQRISGARKYYYD